MSIKDEFESYLKEKATQGIPSRVKEAMTYSLMNGGKRVRPLILFALLEDQGLPAKVGFSCGCAIEMIHTYSLIHDDLPCMDDDDLRRGKPSCHKAFDEATAVLAGDALLTRAFEVVLESATDDQKKVLLVKALSEKAGVDGMIYGQDLDLYFETYNLQDFDELKKIEIYKTAKLLILPMQCACILSDHIDDVPTWEKIGELLGIQFQVQDDILDQIKTSEELGKSTSDLDNNKATAISFLGLEKAKELVVSLEKEIQEHLESLNGSYDHFKEILDQLMHREY